MEFVFHRSNEFTFAWTETGDKGTRVIWSYLDFGLFLHKKVALHGNIGNINVDTGNAAMRATIIVKNMTTDRIAKLHDVCSIDEVTVSEAVRRLEDQYPAPGFWIDTSQVRLAREAQRAA